MTEEYPKMMRGICGALATLLFSMGLAAAPSDESFAGSWKFNPARSELRSLPAQPDPFLKVEQSAKALTVHASQQEGGPAVILIYPLDGSEAKRKVGRSTMNT